MSESEDEVMDWEKSFVQQSVCNAKPLTENLSMREITRNANRIFNIEQFSSTGMSKILYMDQDSVCITAPATQDLL